MRTPLILALTALAAPSVLAQHVHEGDAELVIEDGQIVIENGPVFGAELGEDTTFDGEIDLWTGSIDEPGFDNLPGTFPVPSGVGLNIAGPLQAWNGSGFSATSLVMNLELGSNSVESGAGFVAGPALAVAANGQWHEHADFTLIDPNTASVPTLPGNEGIYALELQVYSSDPSIADSDSIFVVFNYGEDDEIHDAAIEFLEAALIPEPTSLALFGAAGVFAMRRRRA